MFGIIQPGSEKIEWKPGIPEYETIRDTVGGLIEPVEITVTEGHRSVTAWCNEEGTIIGLPPSAHLVRHVAGGPGIPITLVGPLVISVSDMRTGETEPMTPEEVAGVSFGSQWLISFQHGTMIPLLEWTGPVPSFPQEV